MFCKEHLGQGALSDNFCMNSMPTLDEKLFLFSKLGLPNPFLFKVNMVTIFLAHLQPYLDVGIWPGGRAEEPGLALW